MPTRAATEDVDEEEGDQRPEQELDDESNAKEAPHPRRAETRTDAVASAVREAAAHHPAAEHRQRDEHEEGHDTETNPEVAIAMCMFHMLVQFLGALTSESLRKLRS